MHTCCFWKRAHILNMVQCALKHKRKTLEIYKRKMDVKRLLLHVAAFVLLSFKNVIKLLFV